MSHLYSQDRALRRSRDQQQQQASLSPYHSNNNNVFRSGRRDVFSNEDLEESVPFSRSENRSSSTHSSAANIALNNHMEESRTERRRGSSNRNIIDPGNHHGENIESFHLPLSQQPPPFTTPSFHLDDEISMSDAETQVAENSTHTRRTVSRDNSFSTHLLQSSICTADQNQRLWHEPENNPEPPPPPPRAISPTNAEPLPPPAVQVDIQEFVDFENQVLTGEYEERQTQKRQHQRKMVVMASVALCLILLVAAVTIGWLIWGWKKDNESTDNNGNSTNDTTGAPITAAPTPLDANQWAQQYLPPITLQAIQPPPIPVNAASTPQTLAFEWIQRDPYFATTTDHSKRQNRFGLATLYYATGGPQWPQQANLLTATPWLSGKDECTWPYYTCSAGVTQTKQFRQTSNNQLQLTNLPITGTLPPEVSLLTSLSVLIITTTTTTQGLQGTLPSQLGLLTDLTMLDLHNHQLTGAIPTQLGRLAQLQRLHLHNNSFPLNTTMPMEVCQLGSLIEVRVDCPTVVCSCGDKCKCGAPSNIFEHTASTGPLTHATTPPEVSTTPGPALTTQTPIPIVVTTTNAPTTTLPIIAVTMPPTLAPTPPRIVTQGGQVPATDASVEPNPIVTAPPTATTTTTPPVNSTVLPSSSNQTAVPITMNSTTIDSNSSSTNTTFANSNETLLPF